MLLYSVELLENLLIACKILHVWEMFVNIMLILFKTWNSEVLHSCQYCHQRIYILTPELNYYFQFHQFLDAKSMEYNAGIINFQLLF